MLAIGNQTRDKYYGHLTMDGQVNYLHTNLNAKTIHEYDLNIVLIKKHKNRNMICFNATTTRITDIK